MSWRKMILPVCLVLSMSTMALAQEQGGNRDRGGDRGGERRGNWDPQQMRQRMLSNVKEQLKASDEEWSVLQAKVEAVMTAQRNSRAGWGGGRRGGGPGEGERNQPETEIGKAARDLRTSLENENASADEIKTRLEAYRAAREKAAADLEAARSELRELLTQRQEAALVMSGMLE